MKFLIAALSFSLFSMAANAHPNPWWHHPHYTVVGCDCTIKFEKTMQDGSVYYSGDLILQAWNNHNGRTKEATLKKFQHHQRNSSDMTFDEKCSAIKMTYPICLR